MRAVAIPAPGELRIDEVPEPPLDDYRALVQILTGTICNGTDAKILAGHFPPGAGFPRILGHETIGRVVEVGARVRSFRVGDLVLRPVAVMPGERLGAYYSGFGGFAERGVVVDGRAFCEDHPPPEHGRAHRWWPQQQVVGPDFDPRLAGVFITFKETLSFARDLGVGPGLSVLVLGSGPVGFAFARSAKLLGASPVVVLGRRAERLALAAAFGADATIDASREDPVAAIRALTDGRGADRLIEAIGDVALLERSVRLLARGGEIGVYGVPPGGRRVTLDFAAESSPGQYAVRFMSPREHAVHDWALGLVRSRAVDLEPFITHELPMAEVGRGFDLLGESRTLKVVLHADLRARQGLSPKEPTTESARLLDPSKVSGG
ncbi:MAG TPA: zinc-binding dehydrogenase [Chloroflexota bacterium]